MHNVARYQKLNYNNTYPEPQTSQQTTKARAFIADISICLL